MIYDWLVLGPFKPQGGPGGTLNSRYTSIGSGQLLFDLELIERTGMSPGRTSRRLDTARGIACGLPRERRNPLFEEQSIYEIDCSSNNGFLLLCQYDFFIFLPNFGWVNVHPDLDVYPPLRLSLNELMTKHPMPKDRWPFHRHKNSMDGLPQITLPRIYIYICFTARIYSLFTV